MDGFSIDIPTPIWAALAILAIFMVVGFRIARLFQKVGPNEALIVFGRFGMRVVKAGGTIVLPILETCKSLSLEQMKLPVEDDGIPSKEKVKVDVKAVAIVKVGGDDNSIRTAAEQFLNKSTQEIMDSATQVLQAHMRGIVATMTVEELIGDRTKFQTEVTTQSKEEMAGMGLEIKSFNVASITDEEEYIVNMAKPALAEVKKKAAVAEADAHRVEREQTAAADQAGKQAELDRDLAVAQRDKEVKVQRAEFDRETAQAQATAERAHDLRDAELQAELALKNGAVQIEKEKQAALAAAQAITVAENEFRAKQVVPAEAAREAAIATAQGEQQKRVLEAQGDAEATKARAGAEAERTRLVGQAEGERRRAEGTGDADATKARLLAEAEGETELAQARAANGAVNLQELAIRLWFSTALESNKAFADAIGELGAKVSFTQIGGSSNSNGHGGNMMTDFLKEAPGLVAVLNAQTQALAGVSLEEALERVMSLVKSGKFQQVEAANSHEEPRVAAAESAATAPMTSEPEK